MTMSIWLIVSIAMAALIGELVSRRPWVWVTVRDTGITIYQESPDGRRRVRVRPGGYQPIDKGWLATGQWTRHSPPSAKETTDGR